MTATVLQFPLARQWHINRIAEEMLAASESNDRAKIFAASEKLPSLSPVENAAVWCAYLTPKGDDGSGGGA